MKVYYNEFDREKAAWLRELIRMGHISAGDVDERDIRDVVPAELVGYDRAHFFAGVGIWDYALNLAGWGDRRVWTVSCPCQPFSAAGQGKGFADERHLWPAWFHLASQCRPDVVFGEQVESEDGLTWLDLVWTDMEAMGYAFGPVVVPAAGVGAPHGRHRIWFVAESGRLGLDAGQQHRPLHERHQPRGCGTGDRRSVSALGMADAERERRQRREGAEGGGEPDGKAPRWPQGHDGSVGVHETRPLGDDGPQLAAPERASGPVNGFWSDAEWLPCSDGKARAIEPGTFPLAHGAPARVVRLRGYGDGIVAPVAEEVIRTYMSL